MDSSATSTPAETPDHTAAATEAHSPELTLGSGAPAEATAEPKVAPKVRGRIDRFGVAMGTGRRKTAVARVRIQRGDGKLTINNRKLEDYFRVERNRALVEGPLLATDTLGKVDIWVRTQGGGTTGQVGAIVLGIARALQAMDPSLHGKLSEGGLLTRDGRMVERKKYGRKKARRSFQFSKR
jgi:small subunit ribosomal protein S9